MTRATSTVARGREIEEAAERWLQARGLRTVARNFRRPGGEIDLVMQDGDTVVFVEVRFRARGSLVSPLETITASKQQRIVRTASAFLQAHPRHAALPCRFDALAVDGHADALHFGWIKGAFSA